MKKTIQYILLLSLTFFIIWAYKLVFGKPFSFNHAVDRATIEILMDNPEFLSFLGIIDNTVIDFHSDKLTDVSPGKQTKLISRIKDNLNLFKSYKRKELNYKEKITYDVLTWYYSILLTTDKFPYHVITQLSPYPVNQLNGVQNEIINFMLNIHRIEDKKSAENYIARISCFKQKFDQLISSMKFREKAGVIPPRFILLTTIKTMNAFKKQPVKKNILYKHFQKSIQKLKDATPDSQKQLQKKLLRAIEEKVYPAYNKLVNYCSKLVSQSTNDAGVWKLPQGERYYEYLLRYHTTLKITPEKVYQTGIKETKRLKKELLLTLRKAGYHGNAPVAGLKYFMRNPKYHYSPDAKGKKQIIHDYREMISHYKTRLNDIMTIQPGQKIEVKPVPEFKAQSAPGAYYNPPSLDKKRPGVFFVNLSRPGEIVKFKMQTLACHEAIPGHHLQISLAHNLKDAPVFRRVFFYNAYTEGWALYAEKIASEFGFYSGPQPNAGRLRAELFRAVRLVIDTGIHYKKWSRQKAITYLMQQTGFSRAAAIAEVDRYIVFPGQACSYKMGMLKILELRNRAQVTLGSTFNIKQFHDVILQNGSLPLFILERVVDDYINKTL